MLACREYEDGAGNEQQTNSAARQGFGSEGGPDDEGEGATAGGGPREGSREPQQSGCVGGGEGVEFAGPGGRQRGTGGRQAAATDLTGAFVELPTCGELDEGQLIAHGDQYDEGV